MKLDDQLKQLNELPENESLKNPFTPTFIKNLRNPVSQ